MTGDLHFYETLLENLNIFNMDTFSMLKIERVRIHVSNVSNFWKPRSFETERIVLVNLVENLTQLDPGQSSLLAHTVYTPCYLGI